MPVVICGKQSLFHRDRSFITLALVAAFGLSIAAAALPQLHDRIHGSSPHECAVTLIASGNYEHTAPPVVVVRPIAVEHFEVVDVQSVFVAPLFLSASLLEHAPPSLA